MVAKLGSCKIVSILFHPHMLFYLLLPITLIEALASPYIIVRILVRKHNLKDIILSKFILVKFKWL